MSRVLAVLSDLDDFPEYRGPRITAEAFLAGETPEGEALTVVNLCRSWRYLDDGYYVSLLAEARGQEVLPSPGTIMSVRNPGLVFRALDQAGVPTVERSANLPAAIAPQGAAAPEGVLVREGKGKLAYRLAADVETAEVVALMGRCSHPSFRRLVGAVYRVWPAPLLQLSLLRRGGRWRVVSVGPLGVQDLSSAERVELARILDERGALPAAPPNRPRASLAVLFEPEDERQPSSPETVDRLERVAARMGLHVQRVTLADLPRLGEFDALFVRTLTGPDLPSFAFALQAESLGMPVIDDTASILRCCNKVYLHELLSRGGVPVPETRVVGRQATFAELSHELGTPFVIKLPDGSFSSGVFKVKDAEDYAERAGPLFERSPLLLAQRFQPTAFDWRIGVLGGEALFACKYHMARGHWQIASPTRKGPRFGRVEAIPLAQAPAAVLDVARRAAGLVGQGLYGVDLKQFDDGQVVVIEVNDNPNLELGYEDTAEGNAIYEALARHFLNKIQAGFRRAPAALSREAQRKLELEAWRRPIEPRPETLSAPPYAAYAVCGLELEYTVVDRDLHPASLVEPALALLAGRPTSDVELGIVGVTNEIADHVLEVRTERPLTSLRESEAVLVEGIRRIGALLADRFRGARLLPTAMHPWLDPTKTKLWQRSNRRIYGTYERLFDTVSHGWRNVLATHVNLPFGSEAEAIALMNACALLVPYLPALAASSPLVEGALGEAVDNRVAHLLTHQLKVPESQGDMVPEFAESFAQYRQDVFGPMFAAVDRLEDAGPIRREYLNARGAVFKFSRESLEVRIVDTQECVRADAAIACFVRWTLKALATELGAGLALPDHAQLVADLNACATHGSQARVHAPYLPDLPRDAAGQAGVQDVLRALLARATRVVEPEETPYLELIGRMIPAGTLSERIAQVLRPLAGDPDAFREATRRIYVELADCLLDNELWRGRGLAE
ncbi:MAG: glutamate-cysteine ligase family protein [Planctomycetota bacterium]